MNLSGEETKKALKNFPFSNHRTDMELILAIVKIKKAAAIANSRVGVLDKKISRAIISVAEEILARKHDGEFRLSSLQGGAGTASNMNVNEVIASRASQILKKIKVHPNNHANLSQSTNDVNPSALKIASLEIIGRLEESLSGLIKSLRAKAKEFKKVRKLARTHLQDAVPTTLGAEINAYADNLAEHLVRLKQAENLCRTLNLGGTAVGNSINASPAYVRAVYFELNKITGGKFIKASNLMAKTGNQTDFLIISQMITAVCVDLSKMANDLRILSSGPRGGIGEIILPELQKGSSIMPGKVNPVMPETVNQLYYLVSGNNLAIEKAVEAAELELGVMLPVVASKLLESLKLSSEVILAFDKLCIRGLKADKKRCEENLNRSTAYATLLVPALGYDLVASIVKKSIAQNKTIEDVILNEKHLTQKEYNKIINSFNP